MLVNGCRDRVPSYIALVDRYRIFLILPNRMTPLPSVNIVKRRQLYNHRLSPTTNNIASWPSNEPNWACRTTKNETNKWANFLDL